MNHTFSADHCDACFPRWDGNTHIACIYHMKLQQKALNLEDFWDFLSAWSQQTFGTDAERGPLGPTKHLAKEVLHELLSVPKGEVEYVLKAFALTHASRHDAPDLYDIEEWADCVFLVFDACRRAGFTFEELRVAINKKLSKNIGRKWGARSANQPTEHIREGE